MSTDRLLVYRTPMVGLASQTEAANARSLVRKLNGDAKENLARTMDSLQRRAGFKLKRVTFDVRRLDNPVQDLEASIRCLGDRTPEIRLHLSKERFAEPAGSTFREDYGISHLVAVVEQGPEPGWHPGLGVSSVTLCVGREKWPELMQDLAIDIAMFHSTKSLLRSYGANTTLRQRFSLLKAAFIARRVQERASQTYYGPLHGTPLGYLPLGALCRSASGLDSAAFLSYWQDLIDSLPPLTVLDWVDPVEWIKKYHPKSPQISHRKLRHVVADLPAGAYELLRAERRPKRPPLNKQLPAIFGGRWRTGKLRVISAADHDQYVKYVPFLSLFPFGVK